MLFSKKICVTLLAAVIAASSAFAVSAANEQEVGANSAANVDVTATIEATVISATVPTQMTISINPNTGTVASSQGSLVSNTTAPLDFQFIGAKAAEGNSTKVLASDAYTSWDDLGVADTRAGIAIGFVTPSKDTYWSKAEADNNTASLGAVQVLAGETQSFTLGALYGKAWPEKTTLQYIVTLRVALSA